MSARPAILVVDDEADEQQGQLLAQVDGLDVELKVVHPRAVSEKNLEDADLVLVDYRIEHWEERSRAENLALRPKHGVALAGILRSYAESASATPTAFALRSAHLEDVAGGFPPERHAHSIARRLNLEWVFTKTELLKKSIALASAVRALPEKWPLDEPDATRLLVEEFLAIPDKAWGAQAWADIQACHPPLHELSDRSHGLAFLRWLLHRILPYPCFLWDTHRLAARLRVSYASLEKALAGDLGRTLSGLRFSGRLAGFVGVRWWRAGVEAFVWEITEGDASDPDVVRQKFSKLAGVDLEPARAHQPVVCIDKNFQPLPEMFSPNEAVRIQPDDWPPYADQAWTSTALAVEHESLRALVVEADRERLSNG